MTTETKFTWQSVGIDKKPLQKIIAELHALTDIEEDPDLTPEKLQQRMLDRGIRPENNLLSCGIISARDEE